MRSFLTVFASLLLVVGCDSYGDDDLDDRRPPPKTYVAADEAPISAEAARLDAR